MKAASAEHRLRANGTPPLGPPVPLRFPGRMLEEIDSIAACRLDQPDRSALIRELLAEALAARRNRPDSQRKDKRIAERDGQVAASAGETA